MKLLLAGNIHLSIEQTQKLYNCGFNVVDILPNEQSTPCRFDYDVIVCNWLFVNHDISKFKNLKFIQTLSAGIDRIPIDYVKNNGIIIKNAAGIYSVPMAEFVLMCILDEFKQSFFFYNNEVEHNWNKNRDIMELSGKTICVYGTGNIGKQIAVRLKAFGVKVIGVDVYQTPNDMFEKVYRSDNWKEGICDADVVIATLPLTSETENTFNYEKFSVMKPSAIFMNFSRGKIVNEGDLKLAIEERIISKAVLDVQVNEPLDVNNWMWDNPNVRITPHNSFVSDGNDERMSKLLLENIKDWINKQ